MHAVLVSIGTDGDIFPYIGLGVRLRERGHAVTLVASAHYEHRAAAHGFGFRALISAEENHALLANPDFWNPLKVAPLAAEWALRFLDGQYDLLSELAAAKDTVFIASPALLVAGLVHETHGRPVANLVLQPWMIPSTIAPPVMPLIGLARWPKPFVRVFWRLMDVGVDRLMGRGLNRTRARLGLKPARRIFSNWLSPQLVVGMFPGWYGAPQRDWPGAVRLVGFAKFDGSTADALPAGVEAFCREGEPPVAVTFGSEMMHASAAFHAMIRVVERLGRRCLVLTKHRHQLPATLPASAMHCPFAPFQELFPLCAAVVHHGGIGTTARALASGTPQLILPFGFDQMDNAARVERLGAGLSAKFKPGREAVLETTLQRLLDAGETDGCRRARRQCADDPDALEAAAVLVEELACERCG